MNSERWDLDWEVPTRPITKKGGRPVKKAIKSGSKPQPPKPFRYYTDGDFSDKGFATVEQCRKYVVDAYGNDYSEPIYIVRVVAVGMPGIQWTEEAA